MNALYTIPKTQLPKKKKKIRKEYIFLWNVDAKIVSVRSQQQSSANMLNYKTVK